MGTNVYYIKPITELEKEELKKAVDSADNYEDLVESMDKVLKYQYTYQLGDSTHKVHIGKRSSGWKFLFSLGLRNHLDIDHDFKENLRKFLETGFIEDEYGDRYDFDKFWQEFVVDFQDGIDSEEYNRREPNQIYKSTDTYHCGYRFTSKEVDFS